MKKLVTLGAAGLVALTLAGCGNKDNTKNANETKTEKAAPAYGFKNNIINMDDVKVKITKIQIVKPDDTDGKSRLVIYYDITNKTGKDVSPLTFTALINAYQDTDPNQENQLKVGPSLEKDQALTEKQGEKIKKGKTAQGAITFDLDNTNTPVVLEATTGAGHKIGKEKINISKLEQINDSESSVN